MRIIFCDIDGVLNTPHGIGPYYSDMEEDKLFRLKALIDDSNSEGIVIISDRRYSKIDTDNKLDAFDRFNIHVLGLIRNPNYEDNEDNRGKQINDYLMEHHKEITHYVILDDNDEGISSLFESHFIKVNRYKGFSNDDFENELVT